MELRHGITQKLSITNILICTGVLALVSFLTVSGAQAEPARDQGWGWGEQIEAPAHVRSKSGGTFTSLMFDWDAPSQSRSGVDPTAAASQSTSGGPEGSDDVYDSDEDPEFQERLRELLFGTDRYRDLETRYPLTDPKPVLGLQDVCLGEVGDALSTCRSQQKCSAKDGWDGLMMDVTLENAGEFGMTPVRRQLCIAVAS